MGLLDDAIREHLDLKRRRGADPAEISRAEQDALGPVRREPVAAEPADEPAEASAPAADPEPTETPEPEDADRAGGAGEDDSATPLAESPRPVTGPDRSSAGPEDESQDPRHSDIVHQPTTEFRVEDHHDDEDEPAAERDGEDVLEETPDFLQETPEHDRLWFEQRPPRDFDFDG